MNRKLLSDSVSVIVKKRFGLIPILTSYYIFHSRREIKVISAMSYIRGVTLSFIMFTTRLSVFFTIITYILLGQRITADKVFMLTAYYNSLRQTMTVFFPQGESRDRRVAAIIK